MTDQSLLDRLHRMVKIKPQENLKVNLNSWSSNRNSLTTEEKLLAIDNFGILKGDLKTIKKEKRWKKIWRKYIEKFIWKIPLVLMIISALQLFFIITRPQNSIYQTLAFSSKNKSQIWRFFTYSLLHANATHLIINIILQLIIALPLETEVGHLKTLLVYVFGVLSGSLAASISNEENELMVGASSGIYSLLMSHMSHILMHKNLLYRPHRIICVTVLTLSDVVHSLTHYLINNNEEPKIHLAAHFAGAVSGILLGFTFYVQHDEFNDESKKFKIIKWISLGIYITFVIVVVVNFF